MDVNAIINSNTLGEVSHNFAGNWRCMSGTPE